LVPYRELLAKHERLGGRLALSAVVRFESAAEQWDTFKLLLKHGITPAHQEGYPAIDGPEIDKLEYERGWLVKPRQCYLGFVRLLQALSREIEASQAAAMNLSDDIALFFDKPLCQQRLAHAGVPVPASFGALPSYADIRARHRDVGRVMVKLAHGSGAAGCVALHWSGGRIRALTTVVESFVDGQMRHYCSKRIRTLNDEVEIAALVDWLCREKVQVEEWLPKAQYNGRNFDLRVVTIAGVPRHMMVRVSGSPFTNLTIGNRRGDVTAVAARMDEGAWDRLRETCAHVASLFPASFALGIDVLLRPDFHRHAVLEINAFGDLLLQECDAGEDTYSAILSAWENSRTAWPHPRTCALR